MIGPRGILLALAGTIAAASAEPIQDDLLTTPGVAFETYLARWWGAPGSEMTRPIYRIARFDTDALQVHYGVVPGRDLADYTMPYWPIRSFLSFVDAPVELAQQVQIAYRDDTGKHTIRFTPRSGVELAPCGDALAVKIRNRSIAAPEDVTDTDSEGDDKATVLSLEQVLVLRKGAATIPVHCTLSNVGKSDYHDVAVTLTFEQSFDWSRFGIAEVDTFSPVTAPSSGKARAFYAFSDGNGRGYVLTAGQGTQLNYSLETNMNRWRVSISTPVETLPASASRTFEYALRIVKVIPERVEPRIAQPNVRELDYSRIQPTSFKTAPISLERRVSVRDLLEKHSRPKVRGLNLRVAFPQAFDDLDTLREWGCNLVITSLGPPDKTAALVERGHALGMETLLTGRGNYHDGPPAFDAYYQKPRSQVQLPDAHGQDEDHYYWYATEPAQAATDRFAKPLAHASHDERVAYWADCFVEKWQGVRNAVKPHAPDAGVWFYAPFPSVPHVDPVDSYDLFLSKVLEGLGDAVTVFPFYYGIEYSQCEYMMRRWKDCGASRAVFLPMRDFMTKPSQFIRAITAARRGGADGACGFNFAVSDAPPEKQWQWKAVMLGAWANFPTAELDAYCLIEEPATLVEALAASDTVVRVIDEAGDFDAAACLAPLFETLPGTRPSPDSSHERELTILVTDILPEQAGVSSIVPDALWDQQKGFVQMNGRTVRVSGRDEGALRNAANLLLRFAEVAQDEAGK